MKKIIINSIACCAVSIWSFSFICTAVAQDRNGAANLQYVSDDEVVIHSPNKNTIRGGKVFRDTSASTNVSDDIEYDELVKYLEEEMAYLEKLDGKYRTTLGGDVGNENVNKVERAKDINDSVEKNDSLPLSVNNVEEDSKDDVVEERIEDQGSGNDFTALANINYESPFDAAEVLYEIFKYTEALKMYKSLQKDAPNEKDYIWAQFQIGNCYRNLGKFDKAVQGYQDFINAYPDNFWTEQAIWYLEDSKWWKEWNNRISVSSEEP